MQLIREARDTSVPDGITISSYDKRRHHGEIPIVYAEAFAASRWPEDWDCFSEFDPHGVFVAEFSSTSETIGYVISFRRKSTGHVSVLAVIPSYQRLGIGTALLRAAIDYLRDIGAESIEVDACMCLVKWCRLVGAS
ncbi:MAG: GNAT family N-acetyltransferase [Anaerolineae bacterium]|jgi:ribosomal protein S18 acetylase RimI-like enzyme